MPALAIPFIIGAGVSAGSSIIQAKIGSNAAKSAAKTQVDAEAQARQAYQQQFNLASAQDERMYQNAVQQWQPYQQIGNAALGALANYVGLPSSSAPRPMPMGGGPSMAPPPQGMPPNLAGAAAMSLPGMNFRPDLRVQAAQRFGQPSGGAPPPMPWQQMLAARGGQFGPGQMQPPPPPQRPMSLADMGRPARF